MLPTSLIGLSQNNPILLMLVVLCLFILSISIYFYSYRTQSKNPSGEETALCELYDCLGGEHWRDNTGWKSARDLRRWKGVKLCPKSGYVDKIILPRNNLKGEIPRCIGDLIHLREIDFRDNQIEGCVPLEIARLTMLEGLYLYENKLSGRVPDAISFLPNLTGVYLYNNSFEGFFPYLALSILILEPTPPPGQA